MEKESLSPFQGNKGMILAIIIAIIIAIIGLNAVFTSGSNSKYQGYIKKVETQTQTQNLNR